VDRSVGLSGVEDAEAFQSATDAWLVETGPGA